MEKVEIGPHVLYHGDCREVIGTLEKVDCVITDPPYGVGFKYKSHDDGHAGYEDWCREWFFGLPSENILMACGHSNVGMWSRIKEFRWQVAWLKPASMGRCVFGFNNWEPMLLWGTPKGNQVDVFTATIKPDPDLENHPCPKPLLWGVKSVELMTDSGKTVLDPFMGSGTTGVACVQLNRKFIGIEIDKSYFDIAVGRVRKAVEEQKGKFKLPEVKKPEVLKASFFQKKQ